MIPHPYPIPDWLLARITGCHSGKLYLALTAAGLAQSVERLTAEREVVGSIPGAGPILRVLK